MHIDDTNDFLIQQQLAKWQTELRAAVRMLRGARLLEFQAILAEVSEACRRRIAETAPFQLVEPEVVK